MSVHPGFTPCCTTDYLVIFFSGGFRSQSPVRRFMTIMTLSSALLMLPIFFVVLLCSHSPPLCNLLFVSLPYFPSSQHHPQVCAASPCCPTWTRSSTAGPHREARPNHSALGQEYVLWPRCVDPNTIVLPTGLSADCNFTHLSFLF